MHGCHILTVGGFVDRNTITGGSIENGFSVTFTFNIDGSFPDMEMKSVSY